MEQLITRWGKKTGKNSVLEEYPRPGLVRDSYMSLNGTWEYGISQKENEPSFDGEILVPFSPETLLSGVGRILKPGEFLHYKRRFSLPEGFRKSRVILHFGAVDQECSVRINGFPAGKHSGGYLSFSFDVTNYLKEGENTLSLCVSDRTEHSPHARGKQKLKKSGKYASLFYTPQSGIWKTVWLESVEDIYITDLKITPLFDEGKVRFLINANKGRETASIKVWDGERLAGEASAPCGSSVEIPLSEVKPWTPDTPFLYQVSVLLGGDKVSSYFGMRKLSVGRDKHGLLRFFLNNRPFFFNGILDQGYWPESLMTPPSDEALQYDILALKRLGYNTIRKHVKIESDRFYYHCDRIGMIVWQDMPNGGGEYNMVFVTYLPNAFNWFARGVRDNLYGLFRRKDREGRRQYYRDLRQMVSQLYNFPCIAAWVPFNEGWGQFDARKATALIRKTDGTRLVNEACGWFDQRGGDMYSIHNYVRRLSVRPQKDRVVALTEYGGYAWPVKGHTACQKSFGYQHYSSRRELTGHYRRLWEEEIFPNLKNGLCSAIYTQTSDIEEEVNGLMTYDREVLKLEPETVRELNRRLYAEFSSLTEIS